MLVLRGIYEMFWVVFDKSFHDLVVMYDIDAACVRKNLSVQITMSCTNRVSCDEDKCAEIDEIHL